MLAYGCFPVWFFSNLVGVKQFEMRNNALKKNGHPVTLRDISFISPKNGYSKEACDVQFNHSTLFPFSANKNYRSRRWPGCDLDSYKGGTRQAL
jgi:hypothetical protein